MAEMQWRRKRSYAKPEYRPKRDTVNPCRLCGWSAHMAIHEDGEGLQSTDPKLAHRYQPPPPASVSGEGEKQ